MDTFTLVIVLLASIALSLAIEFQCPPEGCANVTLYMGPRFGSKTIHLPKVVTNTTGNINKTQVPCPAEGCSNVTLYLGPRWGSKTIHFPNYPKVRGPSEEETRMVSNYEGYSNVHEAGTAHPLVQRRPIPDDGSVRVADDVDMDAFQSRTRRPTEWDKYVPFDSQNEVVVLDYAVLGLNGDNVKQSLSQLSEEESGRVRRLHLSHNNIQQLPVLTFPVALEYHLQDLQLDHNPLTHLSTYTRFELSRLGNLKILNLTSTGLRSLLSLYIPSLEVLDVSNNELYSLPSSIASFVNLRVLDVCGNRLYEVTSTLGSLYNLNYLNLANNHINYIANDSFKSLHYLETLRLNNNSLTSISHVTIPESAKLYLRRNPWQCSCFLFDAVRKTRPQVMENYTIACIDENYNHLLVVLLTRHELHCSPEYVSLVKRLKLHLEDVDKWFLRHGKCSALYAISGLMLLLVVLVLLVQRVRRVRAKNAPLEVPYNILDDRQVV